MLESLPPVLRHALVAAAGLSFGAVIFVLGPVEAVAWNERLGWPRLESTLARATGTALVLGGFVVTLACSGLFLRRGGGTPVPIDPPVRLVATGLYRHSRNPIYVAYVVVLAGVFLFLGHAALLLYAALVTAGIHAAIVWWEEPVLRDRFGDEYERYVRSVPRWLSVGGSEPNAPKA